MSETESQKPRIECIGEIKHPRHGVLYLMADNKLRIFAVSCTKYENPFQGYGSIAEACKQVRI